MHKWCIREWKPPTNNQLKLQLKYSKGHKNLQHNHTTTSTPLTTKYSQSQYVLHCSLDASSQQPLPPLAPTKMIDLEPLKQITEQFNLNSNWALTDHRCGVEWGTRGGWFIGNETTTKGRVTYPSKGKAFFEGEFEPVGQYKCVGGFVSEEGRC